MDVFISSVDVPLGYVVPSFPSLYWPLGGSHAKFEKSFLYYSIDIWVFTVAWAMIFFSSAYSVAGVVSAVNINVQNYRRGNFAAGSKAHVGVKSVLVAATYMLMGATQGFISGALVGLMLSVVYKAGSLTMTTWIPFCWGLAIMLYHICSSYSTSSLLI